ncbi:MAG: WbqC family protein [Chloroflexota bacterium]
MIVTIHQPDFAPWLGFFDRWQKSDLFIVLDDVQFLRRGWHHRDRVKTAAGPRWLTVPVKKKGRFVQRINETEIDNAIDWRTKHLDTIAAAYGKTPGFRTVFPLLARTYGERHTLLVEFNLALLALFAGLLGIGTPVAFASAHPSTSRASERLAELTAIHGGKVYHTGTGSRSYLNENIFAARGIAVLWQEFDHPHYPQPHGDFAAGMSVIDFLMCQSPANAKGCHA